MIHCMDIKKNATKPLSPKNINLYDVDLGAKMAEAGRTGRAMSPQAFPTEASLNLLRSTICSIQEIKGRSREALANKEAIAAAAKAMFEAGWAGACIESGKQEVLWEHLIGTGRLSLVDAALAAGMRPWFGNGHWRHEPVGAAIYKRKINLALSLAGAMAPEDIQNASARGESMMFDLLGMESLAPSDILLFWERWSANGLSIDARSYGDALGSTVLMVACARGKDEAIPLLLSLGANPNLAGEDGRSALHLLCDHPYLQHSGKQLAMASLKALLQAGADPMAKDARGLAAIDIARGSKWDEAVELLAPFEERVEIAGELSADDAAMLAAIAKLREQGYGLTNPSGKPVAWDAALKAAGKGLGGKPPRL